LRTCASALCAGVAAEAGPAPVPSGPRRTGHAGAAARRLEPAMVGYLPAKLHGNSAPSLPPAMPTT
jgi:hypothetical protein